ADTVQVPVLLSANTPRAVRQLTATAFLASKNDQNDANNSDVDILGVRHSVDNRMLDLAVRQEVVADTVITIFGQNESAVFSGSSYQYAIWVKNFGPAAAEAFIVSDSLPADLAELSEFMPFEPQQSESQLLWNIDYLASGDSLLLGYSAKAPLEFTNGIELFGHTARVSASRDTFPDNDVSQIDIWGIDTNPPDTTQLTDLKITQFVKTLQFEISGEDTTFYAQAGEHYLYQLVIENLTETPAWNTTVRDMLPNFVVPTLIGENGYSPAADTVYWNLGIVPAFGRWVIPLMVKVNDEMPSGRNLLINRADVAADNEDPELLANNVCQSEAVNYGASPIDWMPEIQATPHETLVGNPIRVRVRVSIPVAEWDIHVDFADNSMSDAYWDDYITETSLPPGEWVELDPEFMDTYFRGDKKKETITFTIFATDYNGEEKRAEDTVLIMAENELEIDRNVWNPSEDNELPINFKLDSNRYARIDLYDIAGTRITLIAEGDYLAGNNEVRWDGYTKSSQQVGSGFYLITLTAGDYYAYKKIFIVR
ncbi:hypothetical protein KAH55_05015, partial [bacterium]|nr:hypothetical protein [bacterium]